MHGISSQSTGCPVNQHLLPCFKICLPFKEVPNGNGGCSDRRGLFVGNTFGNFQDDVIGLDAGIFGIATEFGGATKDPLTDFEGGDIRPETYDFACKIKTNPVRIIKSAAVTVVFKMRTSTSPDLGVGTGNSTRCSTSGAPYFVQETAFIFIDFQ